MGGANSDQLKENMNSIVDDYMGLRESSGPERALTLILVNSKNHLIQAITSGRGQNANLEENLNGKDN